MQRQGRAVVSQVVSGGPVAGFDRIRRAFYGVHRHGQGVDVVLQVQAVGQRVLQRFFQRLETVGIVPGVEGVERNLHQQAFDLIAGIQHVIGQIERFFQRCTAERKVLPRLAADLFDLGHVKMGQAAVAQNQVGARLLLVGAHAGHRLAGRGGGFQSKIVIRLKRRKKREPHYHRNAEQCEFFQNIFHWVEAPLSHRYRSIVGASNARPLDVCVAGYIAGRVRLHGRAMLAPTDVPKIC